MDRIGLKRVAGAMLDVIGEEHALGHQNAYASRYVIQAKCGILIEVMFEKGERSPANFWVAEARVRPLIGGAIRHRLSSATALRTKVGVNGIASYGRHSALERMSQLGEADLVCFMPENLEEVGKLLDHLLALEA